MANTEFAGFLYDDAGDPIVGATINLYDRNTTTPVRATTTTDANGYWTISHATEGRFDVEIVNGSSIRRRKFDDAVQLQELETSNLLVRNPGSTFSYDIVPAAITADRTLNLPLITGTDTLSCLGLPQAFTDTTDATSPTAAAVKTAGGLAVAKKGFFGDLVDITKSGSHYGRASKQANGPHVTRIVGTKGAIPDNTLTSVLTVTIPNTHIGALIKLDYVANTGLRRRWRYEGVFIYIARTGSNPAYTGISTYITQTTLLPVGTEALAVTVSLSGLTGEATAVQTFDVQVTMDSDDVGAPAGYFHFIAELLSAEYVSGATSEITMAEA